MKDQSIFKKKAPTRKAAIFFERILLIAGLALLGIVSAAYIHRTIMLRISMKNFEKARQEQLPRGPAEKTIPAPEHITQPEAAVSGSIDSSPASLRAVHHSSDVPLAILRIPKIHLEVPVLNGTDEITLNRGVGQIAGTVAPGEKGNIGIAGHRDSFFRNLKEISRGDVIELETTSASATYIVNRILVTDADDTSVLQPSADQTLTLVTCYPFHFIGPAPRRFIVQASLK
jgi:sortase A